MTARDVVCAVDVGTSAVRAALVTVDGTQVRQARRERASGEGGATFDAEQLWLDLVSVLRELSADPIATRLRGLAIAGHVGHVLTDESGRPLGQAGGWADTRGVPQVAAAWGDPEAALRIAGRPAPTGGAVPLLSWLRDAEPDLHARVQWVLAPKDFLILRLTCSVATDATSAAYTLGSDVVKRAWSADLLSATGLGVEHFPHQHSATEVVGHLTPEAATLIGLPTGVPVAAGGPDGTVGAAAMIGQTPGAVVDVAGTTDVLMRVVADPDDHAPGAVLNPYLVQGLWGSGGATGMTGGAMARWSRLLGMGDPGAAVSRLMPEMEALPPGCQGLAMSPLLTGSRFPDWDPSERGALWGLTERHTVAHILRAAQEGAAFVVRGAVEALMAEDPAHDTPLVLAGGVARSESLSQLRADVLGRPVLASEEADVSLRGAALLALVAAGLHDDLASAQAALAIELRQFTPDTAKAARYADLYEAWVAKRHQGYGTRRRCVV